MVNLEYAELWRYFVRCLSIIILKRFGSSISSTTFYLVQWLSVEIKPEICKVVENLFWLAHMKEHVRIIGQYRKIGSRPRNLAWVNPFWSFKPQNFAQVATVTWMVGSSNFWYQNDRINIVFHDMVSDFWISRLVARESEMNDFWRNSVERHQVTGSIWFSQYIHKMTLQFKWWKNFWIPPTQNFEIDFSPYCVGWIEISTSNSDSA